MNSDRAEKLLKRAGFTITGRQVKQTIITRVKGQDHVSCLEVDYIVKKEKQKYTVLVVENPEPNATGLRRQLVELERAFAPAKVLLLDPANEEINQVTHQFPREPSLESFFNLFIALFIVAAVIGIIWLLATLKLI
jgi:hypothetical protein